MAVRHKAGMITMAHFCEAIEVVEVGPERKGTRMTEEERRTTAYHEAGHALAAQLQDNSDLPVSVTIVPRGQAGGLTRVQPKEDRNYVSVGQAKAHLVYMMAGLAAEKIALGPDNYTTGSSSDRKQATLWAQQMVCSWGMGTYNTHIPLETWMGSPHAAGVNKEVEDFLDEAEKKAIELLLEHRAALEALVEELLERETIRQDDIQKYADVRKYPPRGVDDLDEEGRREFEALVNSVRMSMHEPQRLPVAA